MTHAHNRFPSPSRANLKLVKRFDGTLDVFQPTAIVGTEVSLDSVALDSDIVSSGVQVRASTAGVSVATTASTATVVLFDTGTITNGLIEARWAFDSGISSANRWGAFLVARHNGSDNTSGYAFGVRNTSSNNEQVRTWEASEAETALGTGLTAKNTTGNRHGGIVSLACQGDLISYSADADLWQVIDTTYQSAGYWGIAATAAGVAAVNTAPIFYDVRFYEFV